MKNTLHKKSLATQDALSQYLMLAPFFLIFFIFVIIPIISSVVFSFTSYDMLTTPKFLGVENYRRMLLDDEVFMITLKIQCFLHLSQVL